MLKFYEPPVEILEKEAEVFRADIQTFLKGDMNPVQFKAIRVAFGIYEQRKESTHMVRIRTPAGCITPSQLKRVAEISQRYGSNHIHVTTRQEIQMHYVDLNNVPAVIDGLLEVGLSSRGGGGNTIRNILCSYNAGISKTEIFDTTPYAIELTNRLIRESDSWNLPRKFKIAFSSDEHDNAHATIHCLGFIARIKDGQRGFKVFAAGGMGAKPFIGNMLYEFIPDDQVYYVTRALKTMFDKHGNRKNRHGNRIRFLYQEMGEEKFKALVDAELKETQKTPGLALKLPTLENGYTEPKVAALAPNPEEAGDFYLWRSRYVDEQIQKGLSSIKLPLHLGDVINEDAAVLADLLEPFGENVLRCSADQNLYIRNIPTTHLWNIFTGLKLFRGLSDTPRMISNMIACTGAATCKLGICLPRGATPEIQTRILHSKLQLDLIPNFKLHMSGCPNTCGMHHAADLGFFGKVSRKDGRMLPAYYVLAGANIKDTNTRFAKKLGEVASRDVPNLVHDFLEIYIPVASQYASFAEYVDARGETDIKTLCAKFVDFPSLEENPSYYRDWGAKDIFSLVGLGQAECSAGMFDMIEVDEKEIKMAKKTIESSESQDEIDKALWNIVFSASRMLLVTRGLEPKNNEGIFSLFTQHFIESALIQDRFRDLVTAAKNNDLPTLRAHQELVYLLGDDIVKLYKSMDNSLRFPTDTIKAVAATVAEASPPLLKDFRGVGCPMNFVKTKLALASMEVGGLLEVWLDDGEAIMNVPNSVRLEGHEILDQRQIDGAHWSVVIQKKV